MTTPIVKVKHQPPHLVFFCEYCKKNHYHGDCNGNIKIALGHRTAHCTNFRSPYYNTGYILELEEQ